ncbi:hypothetical protein AB205_0133200 [Aquarana catesbeiana]|uniref:C2H2-type domain-containing protein n=1 Tax=Aquarana catesbeiana TaxID=8400 RepID=A0A2G9QJ13_AQUCT|nr:hypothetical protein AB205_0133200 [Aquarana catesbeiana]
MEEKPSHASNNILNLTLEIIYLLTGEDYEMVKKASSEPLKQNSSPGGSPPITVTPPDSLTHNTNNDKKILEVIKKMIKLLTGEEWEYLEGHKDLYKEVAIEDHQKGQKDLNKNVMIDECQKPHKDKKKKVMMEDHQTVPSLDGSSNGNPPERCPLPLCSTQEDDFIFDQLEELMDINVEVKRIEGEMFVRDGQQSTEEDVVMVTDGSSNGNPPDRCPHPLYSTQEGHTIPHHHQSGKFQGYNIVVKEEFKDEDEKYGVMKERSEGHKEVMKKPINKRNPAKRCSSPLDTRDSTSEGHRYTQFSQAEALSDMKIEIKEEGEAYAMGDLSTEEDGTMVTVKEEDSSLDISSEEDSRTQPVLSIHRVREMFQKRKFRFLYTQSIHTDSLPFPYTECGKCITKKGNLNRHEMTPISGWRSVD